MGSADTLAGGATWVDAGLEASCPVAVHLGAAHSHGLNHAELADGEG